jgi:hypothetical protein
MYRSAGVKIKGFSAQGLCVRYVVRRKWFALGSLHEKKGKMTKCWHMQKIGCAEEDFVQSAKE